MFRKISSFFHFCLKNMDFCLGQKAQETDRPQVSEEEDIIGKCASTKKKSDNVLNLDILEALCFQRSIRFRGKMFVKRKKRDVI